MPFENRVPDRLLLQKVTQKLSRSSGSTARVNVTVRNGVGTLAGVLDYDYQKKPLLRAASSIQGIRSVVDQLKIKPPAHWEPRKSGRGRQI